MAATIRSSLVLGVVAALLTTFAVDALAKEPARDDVEVVYHAGCGWQIFQQPEIKVRPEEELFAKTTTDPDAKGIVIGEARRFRVLEVRLRDFIPSRRNQAMQYEFFWVKLGSTDDGAVVGWVKRRTSWVASGFSFLKCRD